MQRANSRLLIVHRFNRGVTLIEMMIAIVILGILAAIGMPTMNQFINNNRVSGNTNQFMGAVNMARMEAIKRNQLVTICKSASAESGTLACAAGTNWETGWIVFVEPSSSGVLAASAATSADVLVRQGALADALDAASATRGNITFNGTGEPIGSIAGFSVNFNYNGEYARQVCMSRSGRFTVKKDEYAC